MAAVTQITPNFLGGVSKQIDQKKLPGQVRECLNALPDPTFGLMKRPGFKWIDTLTPTSSATNAKWFYINRDDVEDYIGCITSGSPGSIDIWNARTGVKCTVNYIGNAQNYLDVVDDSADNTPHNKYDTLTIRDTTYITNKTKKVDELTAANPNYISGSRATVRLTAVDYSTRYKITIKIDGTSHAAAEFLTQNREHIGQGANDPAEEKAVTAEAILTELESDLSSFAFPNGTLAVNRLAASLELTYTAQQGTSTSMEVIAEDGKGGTNILAFGEQINTIAMLPHQSEDGRIVKVVNSSGGVSEDTYWTKFEAENDADGPGAWEETIDPTVSKGLDASTMPHELFNPSLNTFTFQEAPWDERLVGDKDTNPDPSFLKISTDGTDIRVTIQQAFLYNNRLGFLTEDNVVLSKAGLHNDFFHTSALTQTPDDPIDVNCSSIRPAVLHAILPTAQGLILFSQNQQFILFADAKILTPSTSIIRGISNYEMDVNIDPVDVGTTINFVSKTPSYTRVFAARTRGSEESPLVHDIGKVVSEYISKDVNNLLSSPQNEMIALYGPSSENVYFHKMYTAGQEVAMQAWFKWKFPGKVHHLAIDSDIMTGVVDVDGVYSMISCSLTQTPDEKIIVNSDGQQINPHMDFYASSTNGKVNDIVTLDSLIGTPDASRTPSPANDFYTITDAAGSESGTGADFTAVVASDGTPTFTLVSGGTGYVNDETITIADSSLGGGGGAAVVLTVTGVNEEKKLVYDSTNNLTKCYIPYADISGLNPVLVIAGTGLANFNGVTESGFTISPESGSDVDGDYFIVPNKDISNLNASDVILGYKYNFDVELPKTYFKLNSEGTLYDYTASLTISRMKFAVGLSSVVGFKVKSKGYRGQSAEFTGDGSETAFKVPFLLKEENGVRVTLDGALQPSTAYSITRTVENGITIDNSDTVTFTTTAPLGHTVKQLYGGTGYTADSSATGAATTSNGDGTGLTVNTTVTNGVITAVTVKSQGTGYKPNEVITISGNTAGSSDATFLIKALPQTIQITTDTWYDVQPVIDSGQYLADDVPLSEENLYTIPIHQRTENFNMRIFSDSPFPVALNSLMWEGQYSPRFYKRT